MIISYIITVEPKIVWHSKYQSSKFRLSINCSSKLWAQGHRFYPVEFTLEPPEQSYFSS